MRFNVSDSSKVLVLAAAFMALGYDACGGTTGMGFLQATDGVNDENILNLCSPRPKADGSAEIYGDYVAGRMMKTGITYNEKEGWVEIRDSKPTPDYQGWCAGEPRDPGVRESAMLMRMLAKTSGNKTSTTKYESYEALLRAAATKVGVELVTVVTVAN